MWAVQLSPPDQYQQAGQMRQQHRQLSPPQLVKSAPRHPHLHQRLHLCPHHLIQLKNHQ